MLKRPNTMPQNCAKSRLYKTPRGDYMADRGDGNIIKMPKLHQIPAEVIDLATVYDAPVYQLQFLGHGTSIDLYSRGLPELFESLKLICEQYLIPNGNQELRFYRLGEHDGWQNIGGIYGSEIADIELDELDFGEFEALLQGGVNG